MSNTSKMFWTAFALAFVGRLVVIISQTWNDSNPRWTT